MSATEHLAEARSEMTKNYDEESGTGGDLRAAEKHLRRIPSDSTEAKAAKALQREIDQRMERTERGNARILVESAQVQFDRENMPSARRYAERVTKRFRSEYRDAQRLLQKIERREREQARAQQEREQATRERYAQNLDHIFIRQGIEVRSVRATGRYGTTLRINYVLCGRVFLDRFATNEAIATIRRFGFRRIECRSGFDRAYMNL